MANFSKKKLSPFFVVAVWLSFSMALAIWWVVFAYRFLNDLMVNPDIVLEQITRKQRMLFYEGITLVVLLLLGGMSLAYYVWREYKRNQQIKEFFASFSHDLRTPIASLRLQAESLSEDLQGTSSEKIANRLAKDTVRLELGVENSLVLSTIEEMGNLHLEFLGLKELVQGVARSWPHVQVNLSTSGAFVKGDRRAVEVVLKNIINNSVVHGKASAVEFSVVSLGSDLVRILISDNGEPFAGDLKKLGKLFYRHTANSGSGMGLYLVSSLMQKMRGAVNYVLSQNGNLSVELILPGRLA